MYLSSIKTKLALNFLKKKKKLLHFADFRAGTKGLNAELEKLEAQACRCPRQGL